MINYFKRMNGWKMVILAMIVFFFAILVMPQWVKTIHEDYFVDWTPSVLHRIAVTSKENKVCRGDDVSYEIRMSKYRDYGFRIKRELINGYSIHYDVLMPPRKPLGPDQIFPQKLYVPKNAEIGEWKLRWTVEYDIPPHGSKKEWTVYVITDYSDKFSVVDCGGSEKGPKGDRGKPGKNFRGK
jgi:hypothetical protein